MNQNHESRFHTVFTSHFGQLVKFVERRINDVTAAEEIASDVFRITWERFATLDDPQMPWLTSVARSKIRDYKKGRARKRRLDEKLRLEPPGTLPIQQIDHAEAASSLNARIEHLPPRQREILQLHYWDELKPAEIARLLDLKPATVWSQLSRARAQLKQELSNEQGNEGR